VSRVSARCIRSPVQAGLDVAGSRPGVVRQAVANGMYGKSSRVFHVDYI
jgi:hypothetical protein